MLPPRTLPKGIYAPVPCFFLAGSEDLGSSFLSFYSHDVLKRKTVDLASYKKHVQSKSRLETARQGEGKERNLTSGV